MTLWYLLRDRGPAIAAAWDELVAGRRLTRGRAAWCVAHPDHPQHAARWARMGQEARQQREREAAFAGEVGCELPELESLLVWAASLAPAPAAVPATPTPRGHPLDAAGLSFPPARAPVTSQGGIAPLLEDLAAVRGVGLDLETIGLDPRAGRIRLLTVATGNGAWSIDCDRVDPRPVLAALRHKLLIGHHLQFDLTWLRHHFGFEPEGSMVDTILLARLLSASAGHLPPGYHGLDQVARRVLGITLPKEEQRSDWSGELSRAQWDYALRDAQVLLPLADRLTEQIRAAGMIEVARIECACLPGVVWMSDAGVPLDTEAWLTLADEAEIRAQELRAALLVHVPPPDGVFPELWVGPDWDSPQQVCATFARLGIEIPSTGDGWLALLDHPLAPLLRQYRSVSKLLSSYGRKWLDRVRDGRLYPDWKPIESRAGRMSCSAPNVQQIPRDPRYRQAFRAPAGRLLVKADYSQIELRIAAKVAGDEVMLRAYREGADIHTLTAQRLLGRQDVTKGDRQIAKSANFGLLYGMGAEGLQDYARATFGVELTGEEALRHREAWLALYFGIARWHRTQPEGAVETRTLAGRRRRDVDRYTQKLNSPVQGTGADGLKRALALLWERRAACPGAVPVIACHDELVVECGADQAPAAADWLRQAMLDGMRPLLETAPHPVPVEVEIAIGATWGG